LLLIEVAKLREHQPLLGGRKMFHELQTFLIGHDFKIGRDAFFDLLKEQGFLLAKRRRRGCITTFSKHRFRKYPNLIKEFVPTGPNQLWVADITYIILANGFAYLSLITDAYSHKIVGFYLNKTLSAQGSLQALKMALAGNKNRDGLIHHSDRGVQYCCDEYVQLLHKNSIKISMTENGDPRENAVAERLNGILKTELLAKVYSSYETAQIAVAKACSIYNQLRPHGSINNLKPIEAHVMSGPIKKTWKNYYQINQKKKEVE
jgi:putative transposase